MPEFVLGPHFIAMLPTASRIGAKCEGKNVPLSDQGLIVILVVGLIAGWLAGEITGAWFGLVGDAAIGIVGARIGDWLLHGLGIHFGSGIIGLVCQRHNRSDCAPARSAAHGRQRMGRSLVEASDPRPQA